MNAIFFFALFKADRNAFILTRIANLYLIVLLVIAANAVQFKKNRELEERRCWRRLAKR
jgi:hypothetical protein